MPTRSLDALHADIACLNTHQLKATLIANNGYHCQVWQRSALVSINNEIMIHDVVIKKPRDPIGRHDARIYHRDYRKLCDRLGDIVPEAAFIITTVDGEESVIIVAETVHRWFNIANPSNAADAIPLLRRLEKARHQLARFLEAARDWHEQEGKIIDLYGLDNLVLDRDRNIRYVDSFGVFLYEDLMHIVDNAYEDLSDKIELSLQRFDYLNFVLREANISCIG